MNLFSLAKKQVKAEKACTAELLKTLLIIEKKKLFSDLKYPSLYKYLVKELNYSESEAVIRINAVRLMKRSKKVVKKIAQGSLSLTNASIANQLLDNEKNEKIINKIIDIAENESSRKLKKDAPEVLDKKRRRTETLRLKEHTIVKFDKLREEYGDLSTYELIEILLEEKLKTPTAMRQLRSRSKNSRHIPKAVKTQVYTGECAQCGSKHSLEYDHIKKFSHGGDNSVENIQILCRNCNQRKEIIAKESEFFM